MTIISLLDGTRAYLHAVTDNYSRRILSWTLEERLGSGGTRHILRGAVDDLLDSEDLTRALAQVEIPISNSMIEAFWRSLKHGWLYLHALDSLAALRRLIKFYVKAHNEVMPHSAFQGQTPDEVFFGISDDVSKRLAEAREPAREKRMKENRAVG